MSLWQATCSRKKIKENFWQMGQADAKPHKKIDEGKMDSFDSGQENVTLWPSLEARVTSE